MALTVMTGISQNISFGRDFSTEPAFMSQRAPCMDRPMTCAPSRSCDSTSSTVIFFVMTVFVTSLSSSHFFSCAVTWQTAVRNDCGFTRPLSHVTLGISSGLFCHSSSCCRRSMKSASHVVSERMDAHASLDQPSGTLSLKSESWSASIFSDMVSSPARPCWSSLSERMISASRRFMTSISWMNTFWYGPCSSRLRTRSSTSYFLSPKISWMFCSFASATAAGLWDSSPPAATRGCSSSSVEHSTSDCVERNSISAFGWRPNAMGVSPAMAFSMCSMYLSHVVGDGEMKLTPFSSSANGYISVSSSSSSFM
mmetsp:Transcript_29376/g.94271  ORF Transcript_29376/g.94271 Transcript_29376/m.94271 type:complete len:311 (-) Transcript_29376:3783-4715(-)